MSENNIIDRFKQRIDQIYSMISLTSGVTTSLDLQKILSQVLEVSKEIMEAEASSLMLIDAEKDELYFEVALGEVGAKLKEKFTVKVGQGIAGWVAKTGESLLIEDAYKDSRFHRKFDDETGFRTRCILCVPLKVEKRVIGIAQVINKKNNRTFDEEDKKLFEAFSNLVAVAVENAKLHQMELEQDRVKRELEFGQEIQKSFMPEEFPKLDKFNIFAYNKTALECGGDLYDVFELNSGEICFVLGDVSGKGVSAALFMARFVSDLRHMASAYDSPEKLLNALNELLCPRSRRGMFITCALGFINRSEMKLRIANAGHCPLIFLDKNKKEVKEICEATGPPLGIIDISQYELETISVDKNNLVMLYTDGINEAPNINDEQFGVDRIKDIFINNSSLSSEKIANELLNSLFDFTKGMPQKDDITLLMVETIND